MVIDLAQVDLFLWVNKQRVSLFWLGWRLDTLSISWQYISGFLICVCFFKIYSVTPLSVWDVIWFCEIFMDTCCFQSSRMTMFPSPTQTRLPACPVIIFILSTDFANYWIYKTYYRWCIFRGLHFVLVDYADILCFVPLRIECADMLA